MARGKWLSNEEKASILEMRAGGMTAAQIAAKMERGVKSIQRVINGKGESPTQELVNSLPFAATMPATSIEQQHAHAQEANLPMSTSGRFKQEATQHLEFSRDLKTKAAPKTTKTTKQPQAPRTTPLKTSMPEPVKPQAQLQHAAAQERTEPFSYHTVVTPPRAQPHRSQFSASSHPSWQARQQYEDVEGDMATMVNVIPDDDDGEDDSSPSPTYDYSFAQQLASLQANVSRPPRISTGTMNPSALNKEAYSMRNVPATAVTTKKRRVDAVVRSQPTPALALSNRLRSFEAELESSPVTFPSPATPLASQVEPEPFVTKKQKPSTLDTTKPREIPINDAMELLENAIHGAKTSKGTGLHETRLALLFQRFQADVRLLQLDKEFDDRNRTLAL